MDKDNNKPFYREVPFEGASFGLPGALRVAV